MYHIVHRILSDEITGCLLYIYESFTIVDELLPSHRVRSRILHEPVTIVMVESWYYLRIRRISNDTYNESITYHQHSSVASPGTMPVHTTPVSKSPSGTRASHSPQYAAANSVAQVQPVTKCQQCGQRFSMSPRQAAALKSMHIQNIKDLHDQLCKGAISQAEYEQKENIILRQMSRL